MTMIAMAVIHVLWRQDSLSRGAFLHRACRSGSSRARPSAFFYGPSSRQACELVPRFAEYLINLGRVIDFMFLRA